MLLLPSALPPSAVTMPIAGRLLKTLDPRIALVIGAGFLALAIGSFSTLSPQTGADDLFWPLIIRAFGTVMMFLPLTLATLAMVPKKDISAATGFYSLTRQMGGSIGIALLTMLLDRRQAFHRSVLIEKISVENPLALERLSQLRGLFMSKDSSSRTRRTRPWRSSIARSASRPLSCRSPTPSSRRPYSSSCSCRWSRSSEKPQGTAAPIDAHEVVSTAASGVELAGRRREEQSRSEKLRVAGPPGTQSPAVAHRR